MSSKNFLPLQGAADPDFEDADAMSRFRDEEEETLEDVIGKIVESVDDDEESEDTEESEESEESEDGDDEGDDDDDDDGGDEASVDLTLRIVAWIPGASAMHL